MPRYSTLLRKSTICSLTIYKSKPNKKVLLLSSMHKSVNIETGLKQLPETVAYYNSTKFSVDLTEQMAKKYSVKCGSHRWSFQVFCNILDLAAINAWIIYKETTGDSITRKAFLFQLAKEPADEYTPPSVCLEPPVIFGRNDPKLEEMVV